MVMSLTILAAKDSHALLGWVDLSDNADNNIL